MVRKRPGLPEDHDLKVDVGGLDEVADIPDFLDMEERAAPAPRPAALPQPAEREAPRGEKLRVIPAAPARPAQPEPDLAAQPQAQKPLPVKPPVAPARAKQRARPPRKEVGFDDETLAMLKDLHGDGAAQSMEESLTRSEVARAALRAIHAARNLVDYSRIGPRGKWGSPTARALVDDLTDAYVRAVGELFQDRYQPDAGAQGR